MLTWFLIITLPSAVIATIAWLIWESMSTHRQAEFLFGPIVTAQQLRDQMTGKSDCDAPMVIAPLSEPVWLEPEPKLARRNRRIQQVWRYRRGILAAALVLTLLAGTAGIWSLAIGKTSATVFLHVLGIALLLYGILATFWDFLRLEVEGSRLGLGFDQDGLLIATQTGAIERHPIESLAFDGRWLRAGSHFLKLTRRATKRERLEYGCSHMPRYDRSLFLRYLLPRFNTEDSLSSTHKLRIERERKLWGVWPRACLTIGLVIMIVSN